ncbi:hypothetical protein [Devosia sp. RR2S18]|uniref:hypothetical protein n=1 Tax=Devosia rhizosphaerae TaxID=3049774 RepID=UPI002540E91C|nr:hypothetical protein [Devosia sp. RR2S18]WIJ26612.1 hypothetical protein QOV41_07630 [Devosia sp. RR2S18]
MTITRQQDGRWAVVNDAGETVSVHRTNSEAWRALDRLANEPINRREDIADWAWRRSLG